MSDRNRGLYGVGAPPLVESFRGYTERNRELITSWYGKYLARAEEM